MIPNTEHLPAIAADLSGADLAAERFRASIGSTARRLPEVPAEWADRFTPAEWAQYESARFQYWHSVGGILSPDGYLKGER